MARHVGSCPMISVCAEHTRSSHVQEDAFLESSSEVAYLDPHVRQSLGCISRTPVANPFSRAFVPLTPEKMFKVSS